LDSLDISLSESRN